MSEVLRDPREHLVDEWRDFSAETTRLFLREYMAGNFVPYTFEEETLMKARGVNDLEPKGLAGSTEITLPDDSNLWIEISSLQNANNSIKLMHTQTVVVDDRNHRFYQFLQIEYWMFNKPELIQEEPVAYVWLDLVTPGEALPMLNMVDSEIEGEISSRPADSEDLEYFAGLLKQAWKTDLR